MKDSKTIKNNVEGGVEIEKTENGKVIKGVIIKRSFFNKRTKEQVIKVVTHDEYEEIAEEERQRQENRKKLNEKARKGSMDGNWLKRMYGK